MHHWQVVTGIAAALFVASIASPIDPSTGRDELGVELSKLKTLLQKLQEKQEADDKPSLEHLTEPMSDEDEADADDIQLKADDAVSDDLKKLAKSLTLEDLRKLEAMKAIIDKEKERRQEDIDAEKHIAVETEEGTFGPFREEIKYAIEKNLLSDVALAVHSGIKVEEILADLLVNKDTEENEPVIWSKPVEEK